MRRIIEICLECPEDCAMSDEELIELLELYRLMLRPFICDDYDVLIRSYVEEEAEK